jgi:hypothetical protein
MMSLLVSNVATEREHRERASLKLPVLSLPFSLCAPASQKTNQLTRFSNHG